MCDGPRVAIVGGGISGLACAHRLLELSRERGRPIAIHLFEAGDRLGGVIATEQRDGFILEAGPDSFITEKPWALALCRRLGIADRLIGTNPESRRSFVARGGRLYPVPEGFQLLAPSRLGPFFASSLFSWPGKLRMALEPFIPPRRDLADESLGGFVERRLGREALERIAQPMIAGIYGADPRALSIEATLPRFKTMEQEHGSLLRAMWRSRRRGDGAALGRGDEGVGASGARYGLFVSFDRGMQMLVDALAARLPTGCVRLGARVTALAAEPGSGWRLTVEGVPDAGGSSYDALCLALPAHAAAALLSDLDGELAELLRAIPYAGAATVNLAYRREDVPHPLNGFGFVVPATEKRAILGCTFCSIKYPGRAPKGHALLRAFLGDPWARAGAEGRDDAALVAAAREDLRLFLGISAAPLFTAIARYPAAMAQYAVGHRERITAIEARARRWPRLSLAGNGFYGIGIPDCVHGGEAAAEALWAALAITPAGRD